MRTHHLSSEDFIFCQRPGQLVSMVMMMMMMMIMMLCLQGTVIIIANHGERIDIPPGAILENKIVSGNLRILDH